MGLSVLSGAGLLEGTKYGVDTDPAEVYVHTTSNAFMTSAGVIDLSDILGANENIADTDVFVVLADTDGSLKSKAYSSVAKEVSVSGKTLKVTGVSEQSNVFVDFYIKKSKELVSELQIDAENFAGYYYVEADTLFRRQADGVDLPASITLPNVKIQSNFTFTMASTGDPSTFTFTMDAFPGYTYFDNKKKVLCVMQVIEDVTASNDDLVSVMD